MMGNLEIESFKTKTKVQMPLILSNIRLKGMIMYDIIYYTSRFPLESKDP